jgi:hypothetical protein
MLNGKKTMLLLLVLVSLCVPVTAADTVLVQYVKSGPNGGFPYETLKVYQSGKAELITTTFNSSTTIIYSMTPVELNDLIKLFTDNNFSALDSMYMSGCLACPVWNITYSKKKVSGNYTGTSVPLANIKAGLDALVIKVKNSALVVIPKGNTTFGGSISSSIRQQLNLNHSAGPLGIVITRKGFTRVYSILGQRTMLAH